MAADILVTGAAGTVGRQLVEELSRRGIQVRAAVNLIESAEFLQRDLVEVIPFDFNDSTTFAHALDGIRTIYLITPESSDILALTKGFIDTAVAAGVHVVRHSRYGANTQEVRFARWHREVELYIENTGGAYTFLRPNSYMQNFITDYIPAGGVVYLPMGHGAVSFIDVRDIASVAADIIEQKKMHEGKSYLLTGPRAVTLTDIAQIFSDISGVHISYVDIPDETARHALETAGNPRWLVDALLELHGRNRENYASGISDNVQRITGRSPRGIEEFARDYADTIRELTQQAHPQNV